MSHCHAEHAAAGGGGGDDHHHHHGHDHDHDHSDDITPALQFSLYQHIKFDEVQALNEAEAGSGRAVVKKTWDERLSEAPELASDADEQLLVHIPFTGQVKLHSILLRTSDSPSAPRTLRVFQNREDLDFAAAEEAGEQEASRAGSDGPAQVFELSRTSEVQELPVRRARFGRVQRLALFFPDNFSGGEEDVTRISYIGFKGEWMALGRAPVQILYEAAANPGDHAVKGTSVNQLGHHIGGPGGGSGGGGGARGR